MNFLIDKIYFIVRTEDLCRKEKCNKYIFFKNVRWKENLFNMHENLLDFKIII